MVASQALQHSDCHPAYVRLEADGEQQRGAAGRKLRYFMAKQVLRETDDRLPRVRLARKREAEAQPVQPSVSVLISLTLDSTLLHALN